MEKEHASGFVTKRSDIEKTSEKELVAEKPLEKKSEKLINGGKNIGLERNITPPGGLTKDTKGSSSARHG